jgi:NAD(P)-dependent dehydrogenase (short-subunit alcohol dehydrogenase family)
MRTIAKEGAKYHVRFNAICPGFVRMRLVDGKSRSRPENSGYPKKESSRR